MATMLLEPRRQQSASASESTITMLSVAAFVIAVLICAALLSPIVWSALATASSRESPATTAQCTALGDDSSRLACYDRIAGRPLPQPAKGANAPLFIQPSQ